MATFRPLSWLLLRPRYDLRWRLKLQNSNLDSDPMQKTSSMAKTNKNMLLLTITSSQRHFCFRLRSIWSFARSLCGTITAAALRQTGATSDQKKYGLMLISYRAWLHKRSVWSYKRLLKRLKRRVVCINNNPTLSRAFPSGRRASLSPSQSSRRRRRKMTIRLAIKTEWLAKRCYLRDLTARMHLINSSFCFFETRCLSLATVKTRLRGVKWRRTNSPIPTTK